MRNTIIKSFSKFINESSSTEEMMDFVDEMSTKPETTTSIGSIDTSSNPLWNKIFTNLSTVGKPKKLQWKDSEDEMGRASLNWGLHAKTGKGQIGLSIDSSTQFLLVTFEDPNLYEPIMDIINKWGFKEVDGGATGKLISVNYEGNNDPNKVVGCVKELLSQFKTV